MHEKYSSSLDEIKIQQEEMERLNQRIKKQSGDLKDYQQANDKLEDKKENLNKHIKELEYEIEIYKQDLFKQDKTIESIKADWTNNIRNHEEEIKGYKQNFQILNEELSHTKTDLNDFMSKISSLKQQVNELSSLLDNRNQENERLCHDLNKYETICKEQDSKICQYLSELSVYRGHYENATNQIALLNNKLDETENKYEQSLKNIDKLDTNNKNLNEQLIEFKFKVMLLLT
jgi:chromosome segregation ATPase